ncbi:MAG: M48 family metallopeptidase [Candidatus Omnitrophota bacterium]
MNLYLIIILFILIGEYFLDLAVEKLNLSSAKSYLPDEFAGFYDDDKYAKSQNYLKESTNFSLKEETFFTALIVSFILYGGFNWVDKAARGLNFGLIPTALVFAAILITGQRISQIPFSIYRTFIIEERYGFNRTTPRTFIADVFKSLFLTILIGGIVFGAVVWFFNFKPKTAWLWSWIAVTLFELFVMFIAPVFILPIFNKFVPLEEGDLKQAIEEYAKAENFQMKGIFRMDASRRTSKSNAFFIGFGKNKRVVLFDTLIAKHSIDELVSVLAHEVGHYKKRHIMSMFVISAITQGLMFFILSFFINNQGLFDAFKMEKVSIYASLVFFGFLYAPINMIFSILTNVLSRGYEYQADSYAVKTYKKSEAFILALKKLTVDNLSNLTPHPFKVFLQYSHPPVVKRIEALRRIKADKPRVIKNKL